MLIDSIQLSPGSFIKNLGFEKGTTLPATDLNDGRGFVLTAIDGANDPGLYIYLGGTWVAQEPEQTGGSGGSGIANGSALPGSATEGDVFILTATDGANTPGLYLRLTSSWSAVNLVSNGMGASQVGKGNTFPASPEDGDMFLLLQQQASFAPGFYIRQAGAWSLKDEQYFGDITSVSVGTGLTGGSSAGSVTISVDTTVIATRAYADGLVANLKPVVGGTGISVSVQGLNYAIAVDTDTMATKTYAEGLMAGFKPIAVTGSGITLDTSGANATIGLDFAVVATRAYAANLVADLKPVVAGSDITVGVTGDGKYQISVDQTNIASRSYCNTQISNALDTIKPVGAGEGITVDDSGVVQAVAVNTNVIATKTWVTSQLGGQKAVSVSSGLTLDSSGPTQALGIDTNVIATKTYAQSLVTKQASAGTGVAVDTSGATAVVSLQSAFTPYDIASGIVGKPAANDVVLNLICVRVFNLPINLTGSAAYALVAATASTTFVIKKNGTQVGTMVFAAAGTTATFTMGSATSFAAGDKLTIVAPASADSTLSDISYTLAGNLQ